jgi:hypothetical protein
VLAMTIVAGAALAGSPIAHASASPIGFSTTSLGFGAGIGNGPEAVAAGNFDGHGPQDLVVADAGTSQVNVLLNQGGDQFTDGFSSGTQPSPFGIASGHLGGRGPGEDFAVTTLGSFSDDYADGAVTVFTRDPKSPGNYNATLLTVGGRANSVAIGNLDGHAPDDIAVASGGDADGDGSALVLFIADRNSPDGYTQEVLPTGAASPATKASPQTVAIGHFGGDGHGEDIATVTRGDGQTTGTKTLELYLHDSASPTGYTEETLAGGFDASSVAAGHLGGDGRAEDLAVADSGPGTFRGIRVFLHDHTSPTGYTEETLSPGDSGDPADTNYSTTAATVAIGRFGHAHRPVVAMTDAAFSDFDGGLSVFVKHQHNHGFALTNVAVPAADSDPVSITTGRLSGQSGLDFVTADLFSGTLSLFHLGAGAG